jgi:uridine kinase
MNITVVGIAGGTGSGKSSLVQKLCRSELGTSIATLSHDHYYHNPEDISVAIQEAENWDHPDAIDNRLFVKHLDELIQGRNIERPDYCFKEHRRKSSTVLVAPKPILIVEGILLFAIPEICERLRWRIFVEAPPDERVLRRLLRDTTERGRSFESVVYQYRKTAQPMHDLWIEPSRNQAHFILPNIHATSIDNGCAILLGFLTNTLKQSTMQADG